MITAIIILAGAIVFALGLLFCFNRKMENFMSDVTDFAANVNRALDRSAAAVTHLTGEVSALQADIIVLQNAKGLTPEEQLALNSVQNRTAAMADTLEALDLSAVEPAPAPAPEPQPAPAPSGEPGAQDPPPAA